LRRISASAPSSVRTFFSPSAALGVGQPASFAAPGSFQAILRLPSGLLPL
jgi:hypothetical protein